NPAEKMVDPSANTCVAAPRVSTNEPAGYVSILRAKIRTTSRSSPVVKKSRPETICMNTTTTPESACVLGSNVEAKPYTACMLITCAPIVNASVMNETATPMPIPSAASVNSHIASVPAFGYVVIRGHSGYSATVTLNANTTRAGLTTPLSPGIGTKT